MKRTHPTRAVRLVAALALPVALVALPWSHSARAQSRQVMIQSLSFKPTAPSMKQIKERLYHTVEIGLPGIRIHFRLAGKPLTIQDGRGTGTLTAALGTRAPAADGEGQVVFFWHGNRFNSQSAGYETAQVDRLASPGAGTFVVTYSRFKKSDPACCPTLPPLKVTYGWSGHLLISNGVPPKGHGKPVKVTYQP